MVCVIASIQRRSDTDNVTAFLNDCSNTLIVWSSNCQASQWISRDWWYAKHLRWSVRRYIYPSGEAITSLSNLPRKILSRYLRGHLIVAMACKVQRDFPVGCKYMSTDLLGLLALPKSWSGKPIYESTATISYLVSSNVRITHKMLVRWSSRMSVAQNSPRKSSFEGRHNLEDFLLSRGWAK